MILEEKEYHPMLLKYLLVDDNIIIYYYDYTIKRTYP
jgi:hypothetical protein